jgi:hypothetical protein
LVQANAVKLCWGACALFSVACTLPNPCPRGWALRASRCVPLMPDGSAQPSGEPSPDASEQKPPASTQASEAGAEADADVAAALDTSPPDAGLTTFVDGSTTDAAEMDANPASAADAITPQPSEASSEDASGDADPPISPDASQSEDAGTTEPTACAADALYDWRTFQLGNLALLETERCYDLDPDCADGVCDISSCMRHAAHVTGCEECVRSELLCMTRHCAAVCSAPNAFDDCRKCACLSNCMSAEDSCGASTVPVCDDCSVTGCTALSVSPAIVMQVVNHATLIMPVPGM